MANIVIMPRQGQSVESCIITTWHKKVGDAVAEGDVIFSYETDKSAFDEKALVSGTMLHLFAAEGDVVPCLEPVCIIGNAGEDISSMLGGAPAAAENAEEKKEETKAETKVEAVAVEVKAGERIKISPRAKNLALKTGVDMTAVTASGPNGRIIERDINAALDSGKVATVASVEDFLAGKVTAKAEEKAASAQAAAPAEAVPEYTEVPMSGIRKTIARNMCASLSEMAQLTLNTTFDASDVMAFRAKLKEKGEILGLGKITINDIIFYAVSRVLPKYPDINATLTDNTIRQYKRANLGLAVDTDKGLKVPTIFAADTMSLAELSAANKAAAAKARDGSLTPDEMKNGSFTISNLGAMGIESFTPVINPPQVAILGVCASTNRLKADGTVYPAMGLSLTIDHRAVDGAPAAKFLKELVSALENFSLLLAK